MKTMYVFGSFYVERLFAYILSYMPKFVWHLRYFKRFRRLLHLSHPRDMFEQMVKFTIENANNPLWIRLADKYAVRDYVIEKIGVKYVNNLYGCWSDATEIDFATLPDKFVLKTNNGCATNLIIKDKRTIDINDICHNLNRWLVYPYGALTGQLHYSHIKPLIIAEEFLSDGQEKGKMLIDYKFICLNGRPIYCQLCSNRILNTHKYFMEIFDMNWQRLENCYTSDAQIPKVPTACPSSFEEMKRLASILARPFSFVRIDFYQINGHPIFGEFTFSPGLDYLSDDFLQQMLEELHIS